MMMMMMMMILGFNQRLLCVLLPLPPLYFCNNLNMYVALKGAPPMMVDQRLGDDFTSCVVCHVTRCFVSPAALNAALYTHLALLPPHTLYLAACCHLLHLSYLPAASHTLPYLLQLPARVPSTCSHACGGVKQRQALPSSSTTCTINTRMLAAVCVHAFEGQCMHLRGSAVARTRDTQPSGKEVIVCLHRLNPQPNLKP